MFLDSSFVAEESRLPVTVQHAHAPDRRPVRRLDGRSEIDPLGIFFEELDTLLAKKMCALSRMTPPPDCAAASRAVRVV